MRLLLVSMLYPSSVRPTRAMFNYHHLRAIRDLGHEVAVVAPEKTLPGASLLSRTPALPGREVFDGVTVWHPPFYHLPLVGRHLQHLFYRLFVERTFRKVIREFRPDHVLIGFAYPDGAAMGVLCDREGLDWSIAVLGSDFYVRSRQRRIKDILLDTLHQAPIVFCPGQALKRAMIDAGVPADKITDFRNGVERTIFQPDEVDREPYVLFVGNLVAVKGIDRLLRAWKQLAREDLQLRIIGTGPLGGQLRQLCRDLELGSQVVFVNPLPQREVAEQMQHARLLCLPSHSEGMPNVVLESLACGTPVVGSNVGEIPYLLQAGRNGYVFSVDGDVVGNLAEALDSALATEWERSSIAQSVADHTWRAAAEAVVGAVSAGARDGGTRETSTGGHGDIR